MVEREDSKECLGTCFACLPDCPVHQNNTTDTIPDQDRMNACICTHGPGEKVTEHSERDRGHPDRDGEPR